MIGPNLSAWATSRRSLIIYFMLIALLGGIASFIKLGRAEDPVFTIRTMLVRAIWPGATLPDMLDQVTERIEESFRKSARSTSSEARRAEATRRSSSTSRAA